MVSVIIPTYNYAAYIAETLHSVLNQSYSDFECIIIDDGSTDATAEAVQPFLKDQRFTYIQQKNAGVSNCRNNGLKRAKGEFIQFLDADDLIEKDKLKASVEFLNAHKNVTLIYSDMRYFKTDEPAVFYKNYHCDKSDTTPWMSYISGKGGNVAAVFLEGNTMVISSPVFRKSVTDHIGLFDESIQHNEDWDFWFRMVLAGEIIHYLDAPDSKTLIRIHKTSASLNVFKMQVGGLLVLYKNAEKIRAFDLEAALNRRIATHKRAITETLIATKNSDFTARLNYLKERNVYNSIFGYKAKNTTVAKFYLRFKKLVGAW